MSEVLPFTFNLDSVLQIWKLCPWTRSSHFVWLAVSNTSWSTWERRCMAEPLFVASRIIQGAVWSIQEIDFAVIEEILHLVKKRENTTLMALPTIPPGHGPHSCIMCDLSMDIHSIRAKLTPCTRSPGALWVILAELRLCLKLLPLLCIWGSLHM